MYEFMHCIMKLILHSKPSINVQEWNTLYNFKNNTTYSKYSHAVLEELMITSCLYLQEIECAFN